MLALFIRCAMAERSQKQAARLSSAIRRHLKAARRYAEQLEDDMLVHLIEAAFDTLKMQKTRPQQLARREAVAVRSNTRSS
jgi:hypothetical protein